MSRCSSCFNQSCCRRDTFGHLIVQKGKRSALQRSRLCVESNRSSQEDLDVVAIHSIFVGVREYACFAEVPFFFLASFVYHFSLNVAFVCIPFSFPFNFSNIKYTGLHLCESTALFLHFYFPFLRSPPLSPSTGSLPEYTDTFDFFVFFFRNKPDENQVFRQFFRYKHNKKRKTP